MDVTYSVMTSGLTNGDIQSPDVWPCLIIIFLSIWLFHRHDLKQTLNFKITQYIILNIENSITFEHSITYDRILLHYAILLQLYLTIQWCSMMFINVTAAGQHWAFVWSFQLQLESFLFKSFGILCIRMQCVLSCWGTF